MRLTGPRQWSLNLKIESYAVMHFAEMFVPDCYGARLSKGFWVLKGCVLLFCDRFIIPLIIISLSKLSPFVDPNKVP